MKIMALWNVQLPGHGIVRRGTVVDFPKERIDERIAANFVEAGTEKRLKAKTSDNGQQQELLPKTKEEMIAEQNAEQKAAREDLLKKLGVDGIKEQLAAAGVPFNKETSEEKLCDLWLDRFGE